MASHIVDIAYDDVIDGLCDPNLMRTFCSSSNAWLDTLFDAREVGVTVTLWKPPAILLIPLWLLQWLCAALKL